MAYETKPNTGSLFSNRDKPDQRENGPTHSGTALIDGVEYFMDAWVKTAESGRKWQSFSFKPKQKQPVAQRPAAPQRQPDQRTGRSFDDMDSDVPF